MKKWIALVLAFLMIAVAVCASALDIGEFNQYAEMFGERDIANGVTHESDEGLFTEFQSDGCKIIFMEVNGELKTIYVAGEGDPLLTYSAAALMVVDPDTKDAPTNFGNLLYHYLMTKGSGEEEDHMDKTVSGALFGLPRESDGSFLFMVVNK